jgi:hypothetical protein
VLLACVAVVVVTEAGVWGVAAVALGGVGRLRADRARVLEGGDVQELLRDAQKAKDVREAFAFLGEKNVLHPYVGFAMEPGALHEFVKQEDIFTHSSPSDYNIVVLGGSVACGFYVREGLAMAQEVESLLAQQGETRHVRSYLFALGGYKQPQQLLVASYLLAQNAKIDLVVNIDGYNELSMAWFNYRDRVDAAFPYFWRYRAELYTDRNLKLLISRGVVTADDRTRWAAWAERSMLRWSPTFNLVWKVGDAALERRLNVLRTGVEEQARIDAARPDASQIGDKNPATLDEFIETSAELWKNANTTLASMLRGRGIYYVHLLQPNQYVPGSKTFTDHEKQTALAPDSKVFRTMPGLARLASPELNQVVIPKGYAALRRLGAELPYRDRFIDGTMLFADVPDDIYIDDCCHMNARGTAIMWEAIRRHLGDDAVRLAHPERDGTPGTTAGAAPAGEG